MTTMTAAAQMSYLGLARNPILSDLPRERLQWLAQRCKWRRFAPGQEIVARNAPGGEVHLIVDGAVRIHVYAADGREVLFTQLQQGGIVGDFAAVDGGLRTTDAHASTPVLSAVLSADEFRRLLREEPGVEERYLRSLVTLVRSLTDRVIELSTLGVQNRIRAEVLRLAHAAPIDDDTVRLEPAPRHADLAARVGTTREQVTRELSALARRGLLQKKKGALVVTDVRGLEDLVVSAARVGRTAPHGERYSSP
jgi:CRP-like cAMP-binding protein